jgi:hypothetical protein
LIELNWFFARLPKFYTVCLRLEHTQTRTYKEKQMRRLMIIAAALASLAGSAEIGGSAQAGSLPNAGLGVLANEAFPLEEVQYAWGGRNYCWYGNGWQGPGWYWCGYAWRNGFGWGGGPGWNG